MDMDIQTAIKTRRSIRHFKDTPVPKEILTEILQSAIEAPSAGNLQSRKYYVIEKPDLRQKLAKAAFDQDFIIEAPVSIVVCIDHRIQRKYGTRGRDLYGAMDCAASIQNMMLTATAYGLGTCWVGAFDEKEAAKVLALPEHFRPVTIMPIGYPNENPERPERVKIEEVCEFL